MKDLLAQIVSKRDEICNALQQHGYYMLFDVSELNDIVIKIELEYSQVDSDLKLSEVYKTFILNSLQNQHSVFNQLISPLSNVLLFIKQLNAQHSNANAVQVYATKISHFTRQMSEIINSLNNELNKLRNQKKILEISKYSDKHVVILGKNGSGKTSLARKLQNFGNAQYLLIPAVRILELQEVSIRQNDGSVVSIENFQFNVQPSIYQKNISFNNYPFMVALTTLRENYRDTHGSDALLMKLQRTWGDLFPERNIDISKQRFEITNRALSQDINTLSDGEKMALFVISMVLLAKQKSYIIIDEPENNINIAILNQLYNKVEELRPDCVFIYITHSLDLAAGRCDAKKYWMKEFNHQTGEPFFEEIQNDDSIPEQLYFELLGHRKPLLFCEGTKTSIDYQLFSILFKNYSIVPVGNCDDVIKTHQVSKSISQFNCQDAIAIIDRDFRDDDELENLTENGIYHYDFYKIENLLCAPEILKFILEKWDKIEQIELGKAKLCEIFRNGYENFKSEFEKSKFQHKIKVLSNSSKKIGEIKTDINSFLSESMELDYPNKDANYETVLRYYQDKSLVPYGREKDIRTRVLKVIRENMWLQKTIIDKYFSVIPKIT